MRRLPALLPITASLLSACEPKEARDPADILAEDPAFMEPSYSGTIDEHARPPSEEGSAAGRPDDGQAGRRPATYDECRAAVRHLEELGVELAIRDEPDRERKRQLAEEKQRLLASAAVQRRIRRGADDCIARGTSRAEAACITEVESAEAIDDCSSDH